MDYETNITTSAWSQPPSNHHRLYLDVYNVIDFYDFESSDAEGFVDGTFLSDTLRPTATILWDERFRIQLGLIALKGYGDRTGFGSVDPWMQLLWQPIRPLSVVLGNLDTPHYYQPALFYPLNYVTQKTNETGAQLLLRKENWYDDLYFNYRQTDTADHREKFDLGFVHRNAWRWFRFNYQSHWIHEGGTLHDHSGGSTKNDIAELFGIGVQIPISQRMSGGVKYSYLHSHYRVDGSSNAADNISRNGDGDLYEFYLRYSRLKLIYGHWRGHRYSHEGGDPVYTQPIVNIGTIRWDIILSNDFNLLLEYTGSFIGNNPYGVDHYVKSAIHVQAQWQFSIPVMEWTTPAASPQGQPIPARWDEGI